MSAEFLLGLNILHDTSAALFAGSRLVGVVEQERFDGVRHSSAFPSDAIAYLLELQGITLADVERVAVSFLFPEFDNNPAPFEEHIISDRTRKSDTASITRDNSYVYLRALKELDEAGILHRTEFVEHHLCHASAAFYHSAFSEAAVLVIDGRGEHDATTIWKANREKGVDKLASFPITHSLGHLYSAATAAAGLYDGRGKEGKTMALATYGKVEDGFENVVSLTPTGYAIDWALLTKFLAAARSSPPLHDRRKNIAASAQAALRETLVHLAQIALRLADTRNLVLCGGVALNADANGHLLRQNLVDGLFVYPAAGDAGAAVGAALELMPQSQRTEFANTLRDDFVYSGPETDGREVVAALERCGVSYQRLPAASLGRRVAELLASGKVVGWVQGRQEFGPRALGNRSILAHPALPGGKDRLNLEIKLRESWRPFAPSVIEERAGDYFVDPVSAPHMILNFFVKPEMRARVPMAAHIDGSARIQTVTRSQNARYYDLLASFYEITGIPMLINTSLNTRGRPLATTPEDALAVLYTSGLDAIAIGDCLVEK